MNTMIYIQEKEIYGNIMYYPINEQGCLLIDLIGKKTFSIPNLLKLVKLGYSLSCVNALLPCEVTEMMRSRE